MTHRLHAIPALSDNYIWLLADAAGRALLVDPGAEDAALRYLHDNALQPMAILLTHHHHDHVDGVAALQAAHPALQVFAPDDDRIAVADQRVRDGDQVKIAGTDFAFKVIAVPGHTLSHVAYHGHGVLFCGDTLFSAGCGRLFEGSPAQMLSSLERLAALPDDTRVCCGHEYTAANLAFAQTMEPANRDIAARIDEVRGLRAAGQPSLPSRMADERRCNPFLRIDAPAVVAALDGAALTRSERFGALRRRKDEFRVPA